MWGNFLFFSSRLFLFLFVFVFFFVQVFSTLAVAQTDTTAPRPVEFTGVPDGGTRVNDDRVITDTTPTINYNGASLTADGATTLEFFSGSTSLGTKTHSAPNSFTVPDASPLSLGLHEITATATDAANNVSSKSDVLLIAIDAASDVPVLTILEIAENEFILAVNDVTPPGALVVKFHADQASAGCTSALTGGEEYEVGNAISAHATNGGCFVVTDGVSNTVAAHTSTHVDGLSILLKAGQDAGTYGYDLITNQTTVGFRGKSSVLGGTVDFYTLDESWTSGTSGATAITELQDVTIEAAGNYASSADATFTEGIYRIGFEITPTSGSAGGIVEYARNLVIDTTPARFHPRDHFVLEVLSQAVNPSAVPTPFSDISNGVDPYVDTYTDNIYSKLNLLNTLVYFHTISSLRYPTLYQFHSLTSRVYDSNDFTWASNRVWTGTNFNRDGDITSRTNSVTPRNNRLTDGTYSFKWDIYDLAGNKTVPLEREIEVDVTKPTVRVLKLGSNYVTFVDEPTVVIQTAPLTSSVCESIGANNDIILRKLTPATGSGIVYRDYVEGSVFTQTDSTADLCFMATDVVGWVGTTYKDDAEELEGVSDISLTSLSQTPTFTATVTPNVDYKIYAVAAGTTIGDGAGEHEIADTDLVASGTAGSSGSVSGTFSRTLTDGSYDIYSATSVADLYVKIKTIDIRTVDIGSSSVAIKDDDHGIAAVASTTSDDIYREVTEFTVTLSAATVGDLKAAGETVNVDIFINGNLAKRAAFAVTATQVTAAAALTEDFAIDPAFVLREGANVLSGEILGSLAFATTTDFTIDTTPPTISVRKISDTEYSATATDSSGVITESFKYYAFQSAACSTIPLDNPTVTAIQPGGTVYVEGTTITLTNATDSLCFYVLDVAGHTASASKADSSTSVSTFSVTDSLAGGSSGVYYINSQTPSFTAETSADVNYKIYAVDSSLTVGTDHTITDADLVARGTADSSGDISDQFSSLSDGSYTIYGATVIGSTENTAVDLITLIIDTVAPVITTAEFKHQVDVSGTLVETVPTADSPFYFSTADSIFINFPFDVGSVNQNLSSATVNGTNAAILISTAGEGKENVSVAITSIPNTWEDGPINVVANLVDFAGNTTTFTGDTATNGGQLIFDQTGPVIEIVGNRLVGTTGVTETTVAFVDNYGIDKSSAPDTIETVTTLAAGPEITWTKVVETEGEEDERTIKYTATLPALGATAIEHEIDFTGKTVPTDLVGNTVAIRKSNDLKLFKDTVAPTLSSVGEVNRFGRRVSFDIDVAHGNPISAPNTIGIPEIITAEFSTTDSDRCHLFNGDVIDSEIDFKNQFSAEDGTITADTTYTVEVSDLPKGLYSSCRVFVEDGAGNRSAGIIIPEFRVGSRPGVGGSVGGSRVITSPQLIEQQEEEIEVKATKETVTPELKTKVIVENQENLKQGLSNEDIYNLQVFLNNQGHYIATSGAGSEGQETNYFGSLTRQALIKYQKANNLPQTGKVDKATFEKINEGLKQTVADNSATRKIIEQIKEEINQLLKQLEQIKTAKDVLHIFTPWY